MLNAKFMQNSLLIIPFLSSENSLNIRIGNYETRFCRETTKYLENSERY